MRDPFQREFVKPLQRGVTSAMPDSRSRTQPNSPKNMERLRMIGEFGFGERPYKVNASGKYTFTEGRLKNVFVGGGVRWMSEPKLDRQVIGTADDRPILQSPRFRSHNLCAVSGRSGFIPTDGASWVASASEPAPGCWRG